MTKSELFNKLSSLKEVGYFGKEDCISCAQSVIDHIGDGEIYGFPFNSSKTIRDRFDNNETDAHYWAVIGNMIVDIWADNFLEIDEDLAIEIYGPKSSWEKMSEQERIAHFQSDN